MKDYNCKLGLKDNLMALKEEPLKWKFKGLSELIRAAWLRAWRGYDNSAIWGYCDWVKDYTIAILEEYKKDIHCYWRVPTEYRGKIDEQYIDQEASNTKFDPNEYFKEDVTDMIIDTIIFHLKMSNEDYCEKVLYGKNCYDDNYDFKNKKVIYKRLESVRKQNQDAALDLIKLFFDQLWD